MINILIGACVGAVILILGDSKNEGKHEVSSNRPSGGSPGTEHNRPKKHNRASFALTVREKTERLKLKTARLNFLTEKLKKQTANADSPQSKSLNKGVKDEPIIEKQPDAVGSVTVDNPSIESDGTDVKVTVKEEA